MFLFNFIFQICSQNPCFVTRATFTSIMNDFLVDTHWLHVPTHPDSDIPCPGNPLVTPIIHLARTEIHASQWQATSATSCPGFSLWQQSFVSLCLKLRDFMSSLQSKGEEVCLDLDSKGVSDMSSGTCHGPDGSESLQQYNGMVNSNLYELGCTEGLHLHFLSLEFPDVKLVTLTHLVRTMERSAMRDSQGKMENTTLGLGVPNMEKLSKRLMYMTMEEENYECIAKVRYYFINMSLCVCV